jgi:hypothetical protein
MTYGAPLEPNHSGSAHSVNVRGNLEKNTLRSIWRVSNRKSYRKEGDSLSQQVELLAYSLSNLHPYLERVKKRAAVLEDLTNAALVLQLYNGKVYAGLVDECYYNGGLVIALYYCKLLDQENVTWVDHDLRTRLDGEIVPVEMPDFWVEDIRNIIAFREEHRARFDLDDIMQMYIDPYYSPLTGVDCDWDGIHVLRHHENCDVRLHEALYSVLTHWASNDEAAERRTQFVHDCDYVQRRLLMAGAQIPRIR